MKMGQYGFEKQDDKSWIGRKFMEGEFFVLTIQIL
jgi:hypothetical protein